LDYFNNHATVFFIFRHSIIGQTITTWNLHFMNDESAAFCERMFCLATTVIKDFSHQLIAFVASVLFASGNLILCRPRAAGRLKSPP